MTTPPPRLGKILDGLSDLSVELAQLEEEVPAYALDAARFCKAEVAVLHRRLSNLQRVLGGTPRPAA
jgi:hypothetical protein